MEDKEMNGKELSNYMENIKSRNSELCTHTISIECEPGGIDWSCGLEYKDGLIYDLWAKKYLDKDLTKEEKEDRAKLLPKKKFYVAERNGR